LDTAGTTPIAAAVTVWRANIDALVRHNLTKTVTGTPGRTLGFEVEPRLTVDHS
jgi:hypothetical protein